MKNLKKLLFIFIFFINCLYSSEYFNIFLKNIGPMNARAFLKKYYNYNELMHPSINTDKDMVYKVNKDIENNSKIFIERVEKFFKDYNNENPNNKLRYDDGIFEKLNNQFKNIENKLNNDNYYKPYDNDKWSRNNYKQYYDNQDYHNNRGYKNYENYEFYSEMIYRKRFIKIMFWIAIFSNIFFKLYMRIKYYCDINAIKEEGIIKKMEKKGIEEILNDEKNKEIIENIKKIKNFSKEDKERIINAMKQKFENYPLEVREKIDKIINKIINEDTSRKVKKEVIKRESDSKRVLKKIKKSNDDNENKWSIRKKIGFGSAATLGATALGSLGYDWWNESKKEGYKGFKDYSKNLYTKMKNKIKKIFA